MSSQWYSEYSLEFIKGKQNNNSNICLNNWPVLLFLLIYCNPFNWLCNPVPYPSLKLKPWILYSVATGFYKYSVTFFFTFIYLFVWIVLSLCFFSWEEQWCLWCLEALGTNAQCSENKKKLFVTIPFVFCLDLWRCSLLNIKAYIFSDAWGEALADCTAMTGCYTLKD